MSHPAPTLRAGYADVQLDMARVFRAAREGPADLEAFLAALRDRLSASG